jgi:hypothetical protein
MMNTLIILNTGTPGHATDCTNPNRVQNPVRVTRACDAPPSSCRICNPILFADCKSLYSPHSDCKSEWTGRNTELGNRPDTPIRDIRRDIDPVYANIVRRIEAFVTLNGDKGFDGFIREINQEITYFNDHEAHRRSKKDVAHVNVADIGNCPYTGKAVCPIPTVTFNEAGKPDVELVFSVDFTVTYKDNVNPGTATLIIHGKGAYKGTKTVTFNIAPQIEN